MPDSALATEVPKGPMEKPDPYSDWVLFGTREGQGESSAPQDEELLSAARGAWPRVLTQAKRDFAVAKLGSDSDLLASQVWERVLRSVSKTRQRRNNPRPPIADLEIYLIGAFRHRFTRVLLREQRRAERIELASSNEKRILDVLGRGLLKEFPNPSRTGCPGPAVLMAVDRGQTHFLVIDRETRTAA